MRQLAILLIIFVFISCEDSEKSLDDDFGLVLNLSTPYVQEKNIQSINEAFSLSDSAPWGFKHGGIDFFPRTNLVSFRSSCAGEVSKIELWKNGDKWQVNIIITCDDEFTILYSFEPFAADEKIGKEQLNQIVIIKGEPVEKNSLIGNLILSSQGGHVHFSLKQNNKFICPQDYFTEEAYLSIMRIIQNKNPDRKMCY